MSIADKARQILALTDQGVSKGYAEAVKGANGEIFAQITDILGMDHLGVDAILEVLAEVDQKADELIDALHALERIIKAVGEGILGI